MPDSTLFKSVTINIERQYKKSGYRDLQKAKHYNPDLKLSVLVNRYFTAVAEALIKRFDQRRKLTSV